TIFSEGGNVPHGLQWYSGLFTRACCTFSGGWYHLDGWCGNGNAAHILAGGCSIGEGAVRMLLNTTRPLSTDGSNAGWGCFTETIDHSAQGYSVRIWLLCGSY